ncbi:MAG TPA: hypothetical protein VKC61_10925 [Pyrinomonadaceae bacterium]|nr:hypothetical protein [Pyrinomonadaceae bacterium]
MAETEVESILREIRERVLAEQRTGQERGAIRSAMTNGGNGAGDSEALNQTNETRTAQNLSLIESYLTTTGRAWDRLPPLLSNRSGFVARLELWLKRQLKRATHWYTWEQVNFNASVHHALRDLHTVLSAHEQELRKLHAQISESTEHDQYQATQLTELRAELEAERDQVAALVSELRERDERLQDEQRVCFKQVALETSEAAVLEDRARRKTEALLEELQRRISQLETDKK